jgi:hypothetical protein
MEKSASHTIGPLEPERHTGGKDVLLLYRPRGSEQSAASSGEKQFQCSSASARTENIRGTGPLGGLAPVLQDMTL